LQQVGEGVVHNAGHEIIVHNVGHKIVVHNVGHKIVVHNVGHKISKGFKYKNLSFIKQLE
jgi:hypothetical protein